MATKKAINEQTSARVASKAAKLGSFAGEGEILR